MAGAAVTHQIVRARLQADIQVAVFYIACVDTAVAFADWLERKGYQVSMTDGRPAEHPRTPAEELAASALSEMFARSLASPTGA
jgi:hypothetical protein